MGYNPLINGIYGDYNPLILAISQLPTFRPRKAGTSADLVSEHPPVWLRMEFDPKKPRGFFSNKKCVGRCGFFPMVFQTKHGQRHKEPAKNIKKTWTKHIKTTSQDLRIMNKSKFEDLNIFAQINDLPCFWVEQGKIGNNPQESHVPYVQGTPRSGNPQFTN